MPPRVSKRPSGFHGPRGGGKGRRQEHNDDLLPGPAAEALVGQSIWCHCSCQAKKALVLGYVS
eukprot:6558846-Lingulodinium_polyedra.AAC.1